MKEKSILVVTVFFILLSIVGCSGKEESVWPQIKKESHPWVRWWWMGSAVDEKNLGAILEDFAKKSIGGVEIAPIYGAKGYEEKYIPYLSPRWMEVLKYTTSKADSLGLGVDMTNGTGWPFGGPQISTKEAATKFFIQKYSLNANEKILEPIVINDPKQIKVGAYLQALTAYGSNNEVLDLIGDVDENGILNWSPDTGSWTLYALFNGKTRQQVKRAAPGAKGYTFDHLSENALKVYLARFDSAFIGNDYNIRCFFNDSYEVFDASWSEKFLNEFNKRRGYSLKSYLRELCGDGDSIIMARIKSDYRETMSDMVLENFTEKWTEWAHQKNAKTKNQSHGSPSNLLDLYATVDIPEIETFGSSEFSIPGFRRDSADVKYSDTDPLFQKFASSGAHVAGNNLVSCETFTWLREHFKGTLAHCKPEVDQVFLSGVNHVFYHGATYSPKEAEWPGWLFYASVNFAPSNSFWDHIQGLNEYVTRCQSVLQVGDHANNIMVYWPVYDIWNNPNGTIQQFTVHNAHNWLHMQQLRELMYKGYSFDFVSDRQVDRTLVNEDGLRTCNAAQSYDVLIVPECETMPYKTLNNIVKLAKAGAKIVVEKWPKQAPGFLNNDKRTAQIVSLVNELKFEDKNGISVCEIGQGVIVLSNDIEKGLDYLNIQREQLTDTGLKFVRRKTATGDYYFVANLTDKQIDGDIRFNAIGNKAVILNPLNGDFGLAQSKSSENVTNVKLNLKPGESCIVLITNKFDNGLPVWNYYKPNVDNGIELNGKWSLSFKNGGPVLPESVDLDTLRYWTDMGSVDMNHFSGIGVYSTTFNIETPLAKDYLLKLDFLRESAKVIVNGNYAGIVWGLPYEMHIGKFLKAGENTISIEVANLMANRIRYMDQRGDVWRNYHEINFVNIGYKSFDASGWEIQPSGLKEPVFIFPCD